ncbi:oligosaccharide flippase family protein [Mucilaginibacter gotjawali]|uniref:Colanic acid exporter n=2 Tax=Mucilaginibacter gotjawali TaxID=1550579 RepID=A0A0X8X385_9SPHI|nr:oligosaccharide flippase family protein [Mucilaginibacter gotjawali]MBB3058153.1 O-antigen/teichoic acid export membrane protein [Mucilaginibacter gotjawali]BAU54892.1 colanic acid exporter [Mucilaginibacter gotjawali]
MIKKLLFSNTSWSLISNGATALLGFLNLALIAHHFSKSGAGQWFMLLTVYTLLEMFRSGWVQTPFVRYFVVAENDEERAKLTGASWQLLLGFTSIMSLFLLVFYFLNIDNSAFFLAKKYTILWLFSALPYQLLQWQLQARSLFKKLSIARIIFPVTFTVLLILQSKYKLSIETTVLFYALLQFLAGIFGLLTGWLHLGQWRGNLSIERKKLSNFGKYSMLTMVTASLLRSSDQFIIAFWLGPAAVAVYSIPQKLIEVIEIPVRSFASIAIPQATSLFQSQQLAELKLFFYRQCGLLTAIILPLLIIFFSFPGFIVNLLGGNKYHESTLLLQIFCFYAALIPLDRYCGVLLDAGNRPQKNTIKVIIMLFFNVVLDVLALWLGFGVYGVAAGSTITFLVGIIVGWIQLKDILDSFAVKLFWKEGIIKSIHSLKKAPVV